LPPSYSLTIDRLGGLGDGSGSHEGKTVFVAKSCVGDVLEVDEISAKSDSKRAVIKRVITGGPDRGKAPCVHYDECGGCTLQHLTPDAYQTFKKAVVTTSAGYAGFPEALVNFHFLPASSRRRTDMKVHKGKLAYVANKSHERVAITECLILLPELQALIAPINSLLPKYPHITEVSLTRADSGIDVLLQVTSSEGGLLRYQDMADALEVARLSVQFPGGEIKSLAQSDQILMQIDKHSIPIPANAFLQASSEAQKLITELVVKGVGKVSPVADLFCGIGTYSFALGDRVRVQAIDNNGPMIDHIRGLAPNVHVDKRDLFLKPLMANELNKYKAVIINPPRMGADAQIKQIAASDVKKVVMVSCNHSTWSRDAKTLKMAGFKLDTLDAIDQFVHSPHLELVSVFSR